VQILAAAAELPAIDITSILQFGLLGTIFLCIVFRKFVVPEWTLTATEKTAEAQKAHNLQRIEELQDQVDKLQTAYQDLIIPALTRSTEINGKYLNELQEKRLTGGKT